MNLICLNVAMFEKNNEALNKFFTENKADIACLQEVTKKIDKAAIDEYITKDIIDNSTKGLVYSFYSPNWVLRDFHKKDFHGKDEFEFNLGGDTEFGNYTRSKYKILKGQSIFLQNHFTYVTDWTNWPQDDCKAVQVTDLLLEGGKKIRVLNYHGIWSKNKVGNEKTLEACKKIYTIATEVDYPSIICGDFNLFPDTKSMRVFEQSFINLPNLYNIKSTRPETNELNNMQRNVIDYILVSRDISVNDFQVLKSDVSDHLPLILDFKLAK